MADRARAISGGAPLFTSIGNKSPKRILKAALRTASIPDFDQYTMKGWRSWCTAEVQRSGSTLSTILGMWGGGRRGHGFKYYIPTREGDGNALLDLMGNIEE